MILPTNIFSLVHHFGLSLTPNSARMVVIDKHGKISETQEVISPQVFMIGEDINQPVLVQVLTELKQKSTSKLQYAAVCFPEKLAYSREHILPDLPVSEIHEAITWQLPSIFPFKPEEIYIDWKLLSTSAIESKVVVEAVSRKLIDGIRSACETAGIKPISFEPSTSTLSHSRATLVPNTIILEIDSFGTSATLVQNGVSSLTTTTVFAGSSDPQKVLNDISTSVSGILVRHFGTIESATNVAVYISGEKAAPKLADILSQQLHLPVSLLPLEGVVPAFHVAYTAALSSIAPPQDEKSINLLPKNLQTVYQQDVERIQAQTVLRLGSLISIFCLLLSVGLFITSSLLNSQLQAEMAKAPALPASPTNVDVALLLQKAQTLTLLTPMKETNSAIFTELFQTLQADHIEQFTYDAGKKEALISLNNVDRSSLYDLKTSLESLGKFSSVDIPLSALSSDQENGTVITLDLKGTP